ncbi:alanine--glyoxylate aminotransferase family protein [bacterium]|nr:alanine--glyoxylate aminotransferase family protein [bacterium]MCP5462962.1 alanine--glyoxylate aminotransferase family protein [bacterium]
MAPGPTPVPPDVLLEMAKPIFHHRTKRFRDIVAEANQNLKRVLLTSNPVLTLTSSGTGAMEASVVNMLSPGDKVITINGGKFGERFGLIAKAYGIQVLEIMVTWGEAVDSSKVEALLKANSDVKAVFATLCETSTGVKHDIKSLASVVGKTNAILVVDAISGLTADELKTDDWGVDIAIAGSQKALMLPPGLAFLSISEKAKALMEKSTCPKFYFNLKKALKSYEADDTPWTPALTLIIGLNSVLKMILDEGMDNVLKRHARHAEAIRAGVQALGLKLYAPSAPSNTVTSVKIPDSVDGLAFVKKIRDEKGVTFAGGQDDAKGKIFRASLLGYACDFDVVVAMSAIEMVMHELGYKFEIGTGVKKAQQSLLEVR